MLLERPKIPLGDDPDASIPGHAYDAVASAVMSLTFVFPIFGLLGYQFGSSLIEWNARVLAIARAAKEDDSDEQQDGLLEAGPNAGEEERDKKMTQNDLPPAGLTLLFLQTSGWCLYFGIAAWAYGLRGEKLHAHSSTTTTHAWYSSLLYAMIVGVALSSAYIAYYKVKVMIPELYAKQFQCQLVVVVVVLLLFVILFSCKAQRTLGVFLILYNVFRLTSFFLMVKAASSCDRAAFGPTLLHTLASVLQSGIWLLLAFYRWGDWFLFTDSVLTLAVHGSVVVLYLSLCCCGPKKLHSRRGGYRAEEFTKIFDRERTGQSGSKNSDAAGKAVDAN
eukprot:CAMPEP_0178989256 /NCGR_PEP_ID=MMETSP0795-20121207/4260_1 /TAXON_ID=88552 /ORGANISM="Amoebophrya sp., Strain Ameob2" /LENGTH=333 /DNA_ID=CAMNT_0020680611 /DNA_START=80 /DNA_END=1081 /DNA_ORIENTATION=+